MDDPTNRKLQTHCRIAFFGRLHPIMVTRERLDERCRLLSALPSHATVPSALTIQTDTVFSDTSNPTNGTAALTVALLQLLNSGA